MSEISEKEIEAACEAWQKYWCEKDVPRNTRHGITAALSAAARVRAENDAFRDAVVTGLGAVKINADGTAERVDLRSEANAGESVKALADALRGLLKAYENAFDWTAELPPETVEAEHIANEVLHALAAGKPKQEGAAPNKEGRDA